MNFTQSHVHHMKCSEHIMAPGVTTPDATHHDLEATLLTIDQIIQSVNTVCSIVHEVVSDDGSGQIALVVDTTCHEWVKESLVCKERIVVVSELLGKTHVKVVCTTPEKHDAVVATLANVTGEWQLPEPFVKRPKKIKECRLPRKVYVARRILCLAFLFSSVITEFL